MLKHYPNRYGKLLVGQKRIKKDALPLQPFKKSNQFGSQKKGAPELSPESAHVVTLAQYAAGVERWCCRLSRWSHPCQRPEWHGAWACTQNTRPSWQERYSLIANLKIHTNFIFGHLCNDCLISILEKSPNNLAKKKEHQDSDQASGR